MKYYQNPMSRYGEIVQNDNFGVEMDIFWSKMGQKISTKYFSQNFNQVIIVKDDKYSFDMKLLQNPMRRNWEKLTKMSILGSKWTFFGQKWVKKWVKKG